VWVLPEGPLADPATVRLLNLLTFCGYLVLALPVGLLWGALRFRMRPGTSDVEQHLVLHGPLRLVTVQAVLWGVAAALFIVLNAGWSLRLAASVGETIVLGGITTCALSYLLSERILRPTAARVLAAHPPRQAGTARGGRVGTALLGARHGGAGGWVAAVRGVRPGLRRRVTGTARGDRAGRRRHGAGRRFAGDRGRGQGGGRPGERGAPRDAPGGGR